MSSKAAQSTIAESDTFPLVVGIGASAGGMEAIQELLTELEQHAVRTAKLACVIVQHPDGDSERLLAEMVSKTTSRNVVSVSQPCSLAPNTIYLAPAQALLEVRDGVVHVVADGRDEDFPATIDHFLLSLARDQKAHSVAILLSGAGSDGTLGLKAVSDAGGLTFAQTPESATFDGMPRNAVAAGVADHVLSPREIANELVRYAQYVQDSMKPPQVDRIDQQVNDAIPAIAELLMKTTNHDFRHYKTTTLTRRIQRRMQVHKLSGIDDYVARLTADPAEAQALFRDLLIGVTAFFRDPEVFETLARTVIPDLFRNSNQGEHIRIWVAGCTTGEEAYSLAILCREYMDQMQRRTADDSVRNNAAPETESQPARQELPLPEVQIFATDIDEHALKVARSGVYPVGIAEDVSPERLQRFFVKRGQKYHVTNAVREMVLFSPHNLISDPPFSRLDLISCRNLLIYLGAHLQKKLIPLFHYALRPSGFLLLGPSENLSSHRELFRMLDAKYRIAQRKQTGVESTAVLAAAKNGGGPRLGLRDAQPQEDESKNLLQVMQRIVLDEFAPRSVVVNEDGQVLCASGDMQTYLSVGSGRFQNNIVRMARSGLKVGLRTALKKAAEIRRQVVQDNLSVRIADKIQQVMVTVQPMPEMGENSGLFMVIFHDKGLPVQQSPVSDDKSDATGSDTTDQHADVIIQQLERDLANARAELERSIQDMETANEELKSSNEELVSMNEELQSANEELETSKDDIQAALARIAQSDADRRNLLDSTRIATLFVDDRMDIQSFTPGVTDIYNLIPTDVGRPLNHATHTAIDMPPYPTDVSLIADWPIEHEIETQAGRWYLRRIQPYLNDENCNVGLVVTFYEITEQKRLRMRLVASHAVTSLLAEAESFETVIPEVLKALRTALEAEACLLWLPDPQEQILRFADGDCIDGRRQEFLDLSRRTTFAAGEGLPGCVWKRRKPVWFADLRTMNNFTRAQTAEKCGLRSGVATPIIVGRKFKGVIEVFTTRQLTREPELLDLLKAIGSDIGLFIRRRRLDDSFRDEEARKTAILQSAIDCIITMDTDGRIVDFNPAAEHVFGYAAADVVGKSLESTIIPEVHRAAHRNGLARFLHTGDSTILGQRLELTAQRADGTVFPVELAIRVSHGRDGTPFFTGYLRDITERKHSEAVLLQRAELAAIHAALAVVLAGESPLNEILQTCCQQLVDGLDAAFVRVWLMSEEEQVLDLSASAGIYTHLDGAHSRVPVGQLKIGRIAAQRQPLLTNDVAHDPNIGDPEWAAREGMVAFAGYPLVIEGRVIGVIALFARHKLASEAFEQLAPIADAVAQCVARKESENELAERERQLHLALEAGRLGTWHWDIAADRVTWSNQLYDLFGYTKQQFNHTRAGFLNIIHPDDRDDVIQRLELLYANTCETYRLEFRVIRGDNQKVIWTTGRGVIRRDARQIPLGIMAVVSDVTDQKKWELELSDREAHLRRVIDNTLSFIGVLDIDGTLLEANATAIRAAGLEREDLIGKKFWDCYWWNFDQESVTRLQHAVARAAAGEVIRDDVDIRMAGDIRITIDFMLSPVRDDSGRITHLIPSGMDISDRKRTENALMQRERHLNLALEAGRMGSWEWDIVADRITWSDYLYEMFGYEKDEFTATSGGFLEIVVPEDRHIVESVIESVTTTASEREEFDCRTIRRSDGRIIVARCHGIVDRDSHGSPLRITGFATDITARKKWETELIDREAHLRRVINNQLGLVGVIDRNGCLLEIDDDSLKIAGITRDEVVGRHFAECPWWTYDEAVSRQMKESMAKAFSGQVVRYDVPLYAAGLHGPEGRLMIDFMIAPVLDEHGDVEYLIPSGVDISERKEAEAQTRRQVEMEHFLGEAGARLASSMDSEKTLAAVTHLCVPTLADWAFVDLFEPDNTTVRRVAVAHANPDHAALACDVARFPAQNNRMEHPPARGLFGAEGFVLPEFTEQMLVSAAQNAEHEHIIRQVSPKSMIVVPLVGRGTTFGALTLIVSDSGRTFGAWDLKVAEELARRASIAIDNARLFAAAQRANVSKSEFLANMSHEIRTPMTAVLGYTDLLASTETNPKKLEYLTTIKRNGAFLLDIINDILDLSKIEAGKMEVAMQTFALHEFVSDVHALMDVRASEKALRFEVEYEGPIPARIQSDPKRLKQILVNLIGNAIKFTQTGSVRLVVRYHTDQPNSLEFQVIDTGIGMTGEQQRRLFQPFSQGDASVNRRFGGTGLGLAISQRLAQILTGSITVRSRHGHGSTFCLTIAIGPVTQMDLIQPQLLNDQESDTAPDTEPSDEISLTCRILLVDDRRDVRFLAHHILTEAGATVTDAEDGELALKTIRESADLGVTFDLVLLDMQMPNLDGYETATRLRDMAFDRPIIALTADAMHGDMKRCLECGCNDYLSKPIDKVALLRKVQAYANGVAEQSRPEN